MSAGRVQRRISTVAFFPAPLGPIDRPRAQRGVLAGELHQSCVTLGRRFDGDLIEDTTGSRVEGGR